MKKIIKAVLLLVALAWTGVSCTQEIEISEPQEQGIPVVIRVDPGTRAIHVGNELDRTVETLRVLIYDTRGGVLKWNFSPEELDEHLSDGMVEGEETSSEVPLKIRTGVYDFVYIANEGELSDDLDAFIGPDDVRAGRLTAASVAEKLNGRGNVVVLRGPPAN